MSFKTITVSPGVELAYTDSGAPSVSPYTTIFAIHGMCFTNRMLNRSILTFMVYEPLYPSCV